MRAPSAAAVLILLATAGGSAAASASAPVEGIWGIAKGEGADCTGAHVMVLRDGRYTKALLDTGTTQGPRDLLVGTSTYRLQGARLEIAPSLSLARPEPRQVFVWDPVGQALRREQPAPSLTFRRCPDRPLRPLER